MIIGNPGIFAIEYDIAEVAVNQDDGHEWVYGSLVIHFEHYVVGNREKCFVLGVSLHWFEDLITRMIDLPTEQYVETPSEELMRIYREKANVDLSDFDFDVDAAIKHAQAMSREDFCEGMDLHHYASIYHVGDRSFDDVLILMIDSPPDSKRFIVQQRKEEVREFIVPREMLIETARQFIDSLESEKQKMPVNYFSNEKQT